MNDKDMYKIDYIVFTDYGGIYLHIVGTNDYIVPGFTGVGHFDEYNVEEPCIRVYKSQIVKSIIDLHKKMLSMNYQLIGYEDEITDEDKDEYVKASNVVYSELIIY